MLYFFSSPLEIIFQFQDYLETARLLVNHDPSSFLENQVKPSLHWRQHTGRPWMKIDFRNYAQIPNACFAQTAFYILLQNKTRKDRPEMKMFKHSLFSEESFFPEHLQQPHIAWDGTPSCHKRGSHCAKGCKCCGYNTSFQDCPFPPDAPPPHPHPNLKP